MDIKTVYERAIEQSTGKTMEYLRNTTISVQRQEMDVGGERLTKFVSYFPLIGRGSVLRDRMVTHEEAERRFLEAIKK